MKKFLKVFIIVLLVCTVIGGTAYFFFKNLEKKNHTTGAISGLVLSKETKNFNSLIVDMSSLSNNDLKDNRVRLIVVTNSKLNDMLLIASSFYVENDTKINDKDIAESYHAVVASRTLLTAMMNEYKIKSTSEYFDRHLGANDFYKQACSYLIEYANFIDLVSLNNRAVNKNADARFAIINLYSKVVKNTFSSTNEIDNKVTVTDTNNIDWLNSNINFDNSCLKVTNPYSANSNNFISYYNICNKNLFASNLKSNISSAVEPNQSSTTEQATAYYLKELVK